MTGAHDSRPGYSSPESIGPRGENVMSGPSEPPTVSVPPAGAEEATVRATVSAARPARPGTVTVAVALWATALVVGMVAQLFTAAGGGITLTSTAPDEGARIALLVVIGIVFTIPPVAHWLVQTWATVRLHRGRGRPRPVLTVLAVLSVVFDVMAVLTLDRAAPIVLCVVHGVIVVVAVVVVWLPPVSEWTAPPVAFESPGDQGAPAGLGAVPVPAAEPRPARAPWVPALVAVAALVLLAGHTVLAIGGSTRAYLEKEITQGIAQQATTPDSPARCPWALGWDLALGAQGRSSCTVDLRGRTLPVDVDSTASGVRWQLG